MKRFLLLRTTLSAIDGRRQCGLQTFQGMRLQLRSVHMSTIYRPVNVVPPETKKVTEKTKKKQEQASRSLKLFIDNGLIRPSSCAGAYHLLPMGLRAMEKLISVVDNHMITLSNCQKIQMPILTSSTLWKKTGRLDESKPEPELMRVLDRHSKEYLLGPTHEEAVCDLVKNPPLSYRQLPQRLYQITEKFRDEIRPRFGLMRGRQFLMKDLYTFDVDLEHAKITYDEVNNVYQKLLSSLNLNWIMARGSTGSIGGSMSHEFHLLSDLGEDSIIRCESCKQSFNADLLEDHSMNQKMIAVGSQPTSAIEVASNPTCINCGSSTLSSSTSIEVAHSFLLSTKYTKPLEVTFTGKDGQTELMEMGCFGLGVSRLLAAAVEIQSTDVEIRWPLRIAPYTVSIVPPKAGSKEEPRGATLAFNMYNAIKKFLPGDIIYDDRTNQTIGKRLQDSKKLGIPFVVVCGKSVNDPQGALFELHDVNNGTVAMKDLNNIVNFIYDVKSKIKVI